MFDLAIIETGNGGDLQLKGNDLAVVNSIENMPYLSMYGGNPGYPTKNTVTEIQSFDWWGNTLLIPNNPNNQFNSLTENLLNTITLNSSGRIQIENAIKSDLKFMQDFAVVNVIVTIVATDKISVQLTIKQNDTSVKITVINFRKQMSVDGDFWILDFNDDFFVG